jgi:hypothetical protein
VSLGMNMTGSGKRLHRKGNMRGIDSTRVGVIRCRRERIGRKVKGLRRQVSGQLFDLLWVCVLADIPLIRESNNPSLNPNPKPNTSFFVTTHFCTCNFIPGRAKFRGFTSLPPPPKS